MYGGSRICYRYDYDDVRDPRTPISPTGCGCRGRPSGATSAGCAVGTQGRGACGLVSPCARYDCDIPRPPPVSGGTGPFPLIPLVLNKIEADNALALVIVPVWPNQRWWQRLQTSMSHRIRRSFSLPPDSLRLNNRHCCFGVRFQSPRRVLFFVPTGPMSEAP